MSDNSMWRRRDFLAGLAALGGALITNPLSAEPTSPSVSNPAPKPIPPVLPVASDAYILAHRNDEPNSSCSLYSLTSREVTHIPVEGNVHVYNQHPIHKNIVFGTEKHKTNGFVVDLQARRVIKTIKAPRNHIFYGHVCYDPQGKFAFVTAETAVDRTGKVLVYDCETWDLVEMNVSGGTRPHELMAIDDTTFIVVNEAAFLFAREASVAYLTFDTLHVERRIMAPPVDHILRVGNDIVLSGSIDGLPTSLAAYDIAGERVRSYADAEGASELHCKGEGLSMCELNPDEVLLSIPEAKQILRWNLKVDRASVTKAPDKIQGLVSQGGHVYANDAHHRLYRFPVSSVPSTLNSSPVHANFANGRHMRIVQF